jgi:hypothetical protein
MLTEFVGRKQGIAATALAGGRQRAANVAAQLSRRGRMKASAELCNEAVGALVRLCYQGDTDGNPANVDGATGRLLIPVPWGEKGHKYYGLRSTEQRALRRYMFDLQEHTAAGAPLFTYDGPERSWYLNVWDFPSGPVALEYWQRCGMSEKAYRERVR